MAGLTGRGPKDSYTELLKVSTSGGLGESISSVTDGKGEVTPLGLSKSSIHLHGVKWPSTVGLTGESLRLNSAATALEWGKTITPTEMILKANFVGQVTETTGVSRFYPPSDIVITKVYCSISSPGTSFNEFNVKVNDVSIFTGDKPSIGANLHRSTDYPLNHPVPNTSYITVDITKASGSDLVVYIIYQYQ